MIVHTRAIHRFVWWGIVIFCSGVIRIKFLRTPVHIRVWNLKVTQALAVEGWYPIASTIGRWKNLQKVEKSRRKVGYWQNGLEGNTGVLTFAAILLSALCDHQQVGNTGWSPPWCPDSQHDLRDNSQQALRKALRLLLWWTVFPFKLISLSGLCTTVIERWLTHLLQSTILIFFGINA